MDWSPHDDLVFVHLQFFRGAFLVLRLAHGELQDSVTAGSSTQFRAVSRVVLAAGYNRNGGTDEEARLDTSDAELGDGVHGRCTLHGCETAGSDSN